MRQYLYKIPYSGVAPILVEKPGDEIRIGWVRGILEAISSKDRGIYILSEQAPCEVHNFSEYFVRSFDKEG